MPLRKLVTYRRALPFACARGRAGWNFGDTPRIQQIWINLTSVGNAILVDQRRFVNDKIRWDVTAGFDCRGRPEVRDDHSDQRGRQYRTAHSCLPSTSEMQSSDFRCGMRKDAEERPLLPRRPIRGAGIGSINFLDPASL